MVESPQAGLAFEGVYNESLTSLDLPINHSAHFLLFGKTKYIANIVRVL